MPVKSRNIRDSFPRRITHNGTTVVDDVLSYSSDNSEIRCSNHPRNVRRSGMCEHSQHFIWPAANSHTYFGGTSGTSDRWVSTPTAFGVSSLCGTVHQPDGFDKRALEAEAFRVMSPGMESGFSATNFLLELRDMRLLLRFWDRTRSGINNAARLKLSYDYGWKQTVRDCAQIVKRLRSFSERYSALIKGQGALQKRHFRKTIASSRATVEQGVYSWGIDAVKYVYTYNQPYIFSATMAYRYRLPEMSNAARKARALADHFGLKLNAFVIWEAIPLSFVVDWFVGVGDFLQQFDSKWIEPQIEILDFCCSAKWDVTVQVYCRRNTRNPANSAWVLSHTVRHKNYSRWLSMPDVHALKSMELNDKAWDANRYALAASLLIVKS